MEKEFEKIAVKIVVKCPDCGGEGKVKGRWFNRFLIVTCKECAGSGVRDCNYGWDKFCKMVKETG